MIPRTSAHRTTVSVPRLLLGVVLLFAFAASSACAQQRPTRVRAKMDGFDVAAKSGKSPNQVGGASRGLGGFALYAPREGKSYSQTPTFYWESADPRGAYTFRLAAANDPQNAIFSTKVTGGWFTYPASAPALQSGMAYVWTVQPELDMLGGPVAAKIWIVGGAERDAITAALAAAAAQPDPSLAQAHVYADKRLWFDAITAYNMLIQQNPSRGELYQARADLYDQLPATQSLADADAARARR